MNCTKKVFVFCALEIVIILFYAIGCSSVVLRGENNKRYRAREEKLIANAVSFPCGAVERKIKALRVRYVTCLYRRRARGFQTAIAAALVVVRCGHGTTLQRFQLSRRK